MIRKTLIHTNGEPYEVEIPIDGAAYIEIPHGMSRKPGDVHWCPWAQSEGVMDSSVRSFCAVCIRFRPLDIMLPEYDFSQGEWGKYKEPF